MKRYRRRNKTVFENNAYIGAYADISFDITSDTEYGKESMHFDTRIHYYEKGEGEPLLLLHGLGQSLYTWRHNIDFFAENGFRVIAPDMPGFGYSGHVNIFYTVEENALAVRAFLDALRIKKTHIAGVSTGAICALCFAGAYPKRTDKLVLVTPGGPNENYPFLLRFLTTRMGEFMMHTFLREATLINVLRRFYFDATLLSGDVAAQYYEPYKNKEVRETLIRTVMHFDAEVARAALKTMQKHVLIFTGTEDRLHQKEDMRVYPNTIRNARHIQIRNCAQNVHEEKAERFNAETLAFLHKES